MDKERAVKGNYASLQDVVGFVSFRAGVDNGACGFMWVWVRAGSGACGLMRFGSALAVVPLVSCGRVRVLAVVSPVSSGAERASAVASPVSCAAERALAVVPVVSRHHARLRSSRRAMPQRHT